MGKIKKSQNNEVVNNKFWNFVAQTEEDPPELILYGAISSSQSWYEDRITPMSFNEDLKALGDVDEIVVRINSGGGDVFAANAIYTRLKDCKAKITVKIDGWAASAATIIAMAGDVIQIPSNGVFMIHDPKLLAWDYYTSEQFISLAEELKVIKQSIINGYALKTGKDEDEISNLMSAETWLAGNDAVESGFCDELMFEEVETEVENSSHIIVNSIELDISKYKNVPSMLLNSPKPNKGKDNFINKVVNQKQKEKESVNNMEANAIKTVAELEKTYPDLVQNIKNDSATTERERIKAINEMAMDGFDDIVNKAMFDEPVAVEKVAMDIIAKQKEMGTNYLNNRELDIQNSNVNNVGTLEVGERGSNKSEEVKDQEDANFMAKVMNGGI